MACRQTGFALLAPARCRKRTTSPASPTPRRSQARVPFLHFFDGFRTSHEVAKIEELTDDDLRAMIDDELVAAHRARALTPDHPVLRGTRAEPRRLLPGPRGVQPLLRSPAPSIVAGARWTASPTLTGRQYHLFDYVGASRRRARHRAHGLGRRDGRTRPCEWLLRTRREGRRAEGAPVPALRRRRPSSPRCRRPCARSPCSTAPRSPAPSASRSTSTSSTALREARDGGTSPLAHDPTVIGGRYGLSSKEFTPAMVQGGLRRARARRSPKHHFTVGIVDDVTHTSLPVDPDFDIEPDDVVRAVFFGLAPTAPSAPTRTRSRSSARRPTTTPRATSSTTRRSPARSPSRTCASARGRSARPTSIKRASFVACHQFSFLEKYDVLEYAAPGAVFLLNAPVRRRRGLGPPAARGAAADHRQAAQVLRDRRLRGGQATPAWAAHQHDHADLLLRHLRRAAARRGDRADQEGDREDLPARRARRSCRRTSPPSTRRWRTCTRCRCPARGHRDARACRRSSPHEAPDFVQAGHRRDAGRQGRPAAGQRLPGRRHLAARHRAVGEAQHRPGDPGLGRRRSASSATSARWSARTPPSAPRSTTPEQLAGAPATFKSIDYKAARLQGRASTPSRSRRRTAPAARCASRSARPRTRRNPKHKAINMHPQPPLRDAERANYDFFLGLPEADRTDAAHRRQERRSSSSRSSSSPAPAPAAARRRTSSCSPSSSATALLIANATGCSSIYGGNLPTTPYTTNRDGRGPAWSNSLFEDNAEFGLGIRLAVDKHAEQRARAARRGWRRSVGERAGRRASSNADQDDRGRHRRAARSGSSALRQKLAEPAAPEARAARRARRLPGAARASGSSAATAGPTTSATAASTTCSPSGRNVNILVLDTEVYSNTGGQAVEGDAARRRRQVRRRRQGDAEEGPRA